MHILALADEPVQRLWGGYGQETLKAADLILSAGDLSAAYLSYMTCFTSAPAGSVLISSKPFSDSRS